MKIQRFMGPWAFADSTKSWDVTSTHRQCASGLTDLGFLGQVAEKDNVIKQMKEEVGKKQLGIKKAELR